jgi:hypothetical protein
MPPTLRDTIDDFANTFAASILGALKSASLEELLALAGGGAAAPPAQSPARARRAKATRTAKAAAPVSAPKAARVVKTKGGRLRRRSAADIAKALAAVVALVKKNPKGLRAEQIRGQLKMESREMPRVLKEGLTKKLLKSRGQKRSTTYAAA